MNSQETRQLIRRIRTSGIGIVGGGRVCHKLITFFREQDLQPEKPRVLGVVDINPNAVGIQFARELGIFTSNDYHALFGVDGIDIILEVTLDADLAHHIRNDKPDHVTLADHFQVRNIWDALLTENLRLSLMGELSEKKSDPGQIEALFQKSFDEFEQFIARRNDRIRRIERELVENQRTQSQIIQGSTIPTFFINKDHIVTHWNRAMEALSGWRAEAIVGTNHQWAPFWRQERPTMADVILDQIDEGEIQKLYGSQWRKSVLIDGAYEAEIFFSQVGNGGKWLWFTAAPIKGPDGEIVGAIETIWDKSEDKKSEEQRERHTAELAALLAIYTALSAPWKVDYRIEAALKEIRRFISADDVGIYLQNETDTFYLAYHYGVAYKAFADQQLVVPQALVQQVVASSQMLIMENIDPEAQPDLVEFARRGSRSLILIPISAKEKKVIGVLQIAGKPEGRFASEEHHVLDLIANRIGVAIENAMLQDQYIKSEEKYRSLFNHDPNPIFIIDHHTFEIIDINERAVECYGLSRADIIGSTFFSLGDAADREVRKGMERLQPGQSILFSKKRHFRDGGSAFYVNINVRHAQYSESDVLIATTTDISETVQRETQLIQVSKMTTLGLMAAGMAHEINQPLNVIQICADFFLKMLNKGQPINDDELRSMANDIVANVERATGIIRHVRDFARQSEVAKSEVNINNPINDVFKVLGHQLKVHQIVLGLELDRNIPSILADHNRLEQVFINLVNNAIDAMDEKAEQPEFKNMEKRLTIRTSSSAGRVIATVEDNGVGMTEEVQQQFFEPFFTTKKIGKGTGLGGSISYGIVKDYEGTIAVQSEPGQGTTFTLSFPAVNHGA